MFGQSPTLRRVAIYRPGEQIANGLFNGWAPWLIFVWNSFLQRPIDFLSAFYCGNYGGSVSLDSTVDNEPTPNTLSHLRRRCFGYLGGILSVAADSIPSSRGLPDKLDPVGLSALFLQADADVGCDSRHEFDSPNVATCFWMVECVEPPCKSGCVNTNYAAKRNRWLTKAQLSMSISGSRPR